ncbi:MAG: SIMPL domain-containing protein [Candidatus Pedobacter colombiensis]|uniref:SIMPL domain-containing protein n=1 Tax=Candidatus Pedobacter colombiensis TaxID=3121371 RepID=A0AAJ5W829_9SPHI|nr:SIMPL domain-containing protein [Pedobacter sp.]WEK18926.1 MAG: SIMPL domain-containing protein [Pedobacter sp.]
MKKLLSLAIVALFSLSAMAQQVDLRKKINVSGSAETEVTPDIIYISISLKEYLKDGNSKKKVDITTLENELFTAVQKAGLEKENLTINNLSSYTVAAEKKKNPDYLASKQYRLKVSDLNKWNAIIGNVDPKGVAYTNIDSYDYSKIESLKKELKIKALLAAKEKATYLVQALGDKLGSAIDIQEINNESFARPMYANVMMKSESADMAGAGAQDIDFKKIKLNYQMNVVFEIKGI